MKKLLMLILVCSISGSFVIEKKCTAVINPEYQSEYNKLKQHMIEIGEEKATDEYIVSYLKKIGTPVALQLIDDCVNFDRYCDEGDRLMKAQKYAEAINYFTLAISLKCENASSSLENFQFLWSKRGTAYFEIGNFYQAINDYTVAISIDPKNGFYYLQRASAYSGIKNFDAGMNDVKIAASLGNADAQALLNAQAKSKMITSESIAKSIASRFYSQNPKDIEKSIQKAIDYNLK